MAISMRGLICILGLTALAGCSSDEDGSGATGTGPASAGRGGVVFGSCLYTNGTCEDFTGKALEAAAVELKDGCGLQGGTHSRAACTATDRVATCVFNKGEGNEYYMHAYAPLTKAKALEACRGAGGFEVQ